MIKNSKTLSENRKFVVFAVKPAIISKFKAFFPRITGFTAKTHQNQTNVLFAMKPTITSKKHDTFSTYNREHVINIQKFKNII